MDSEPSFDDGRRRIPREVVGSEGFTYSIGEQIGSGSSGGVYLAIRRPDGQQVAVKAIRLDRLRVQEDRKTLDREIAILRSLRHKSIVELYDVVEADSFVYIVMEYVSGGELFQRITDDPSFKNEDVVKYLFVQVVDAVLYMHAHDVLHRDIKAENILVSLSSPNPPPEDLDTPGLPAYPQIKIADFGLSKRVSDASSLATTWVGTPQYWAPEVLLSRDTHKPYDGRVDIWSLGVLLFVTLGKRYPFAEGKNSSSPLPMTERILRGIFDFTHTARPIPPLAQDLIKKLIVPDPAGRLTLEEVLVHPWLQGFKPAERAARVWPKKSEIFSVVSVEEDEESVDMEAEGKEVGPAEAPGVRILSSNPTQPSSTLMVSRPQGMPSSPPPSTPSSALLPLFPNLAISSTPSAIPLTELAHCQTEITRTLNRVLLQLRDRPAMLRVAADLLRRARELYFLSARTISGFALTAEAVEGVLLDASAFVDASHGEAAIDCLNEVRGHVAGMHGQSQGVQGEYRRLAGDIHKLLRASEAAAGMGVAGAVKGVQAIADKGEEGHVEEQHSTGDCQVPENQPPSHASTSMSSVRAAPQQLPETTRLLLRRVAGGQVAQLSAEQQMDLLEILGVLNFTRNIEAGLCMPSTPAEEQPTNSAIANRSSSSSSSSRSPSPAREIQSIPWHPNPLHQTLNESLAVAFGPGSNPAEFSLLSLAARDLRRVDAILERCRLFWSNVEQCVHRLNLFKEAAARLLESATTSVSIKARYHQRMQQHIAFWAAFRETCSDYASQAQLEYQRMIDDAGRMADAVDAVMTGSIARRQ